MPEIKDVTDAQAEAKRIVRRQMDEDVKSVSIDSTEISDKGDFSVYEVTGIAEVKSGFFGSEDKPFKVQLKTDGSVVGFRA